MSGPTKTIGGRHIGWHADPYGRYRMRWWDGNHWTERVLGEAGHGIDPPGINAAPRAPSAATKGPAAPIEGALQPIKAPAIADKIAVLFGFVVFLALISVLVVALAT